MNVLFALLFFFIIAPLSAAIGYYFYKLWIKLPDIIRYILFLPIALLVSVVASFVLLMVVFRDMIFSDQETFWITHVIPILAPGFAVLAFVLAALWLCPAYEKKIIKVCLALNLALHCALWLFAIFVTVHLGAPFWHETTPVELGQSVVAVLTTALIWKNLDALHVYKIGTLDS